MLQGGEAMIEMQPIITNPIARPDKKVRDEPKSGKKQPPGKSANKQQQPPAADHIDEIV